MVFRVFLSLCCYSDYFRSNMYVLCLYMDGVYLLRMNMFLLYSRLPLHAIPIDREKHLLTVRSYTRLYTCVRVCESGICFGLLL